jgi:RNA polymerase sigma-70 factor (ECF subfamily)
VVPAKHADELRSIEQARLQLIRRIAAGEQDALGQLYDSTNRTVFGLIVRILNDPAAAEEVALEVYTQVWRQASSYDPRRGTPSAWLLTIARSRAIDRFRSTDQARRRQEPLSTVETARADITDPEESASEAERRELVRAALDALPPEQREVIELAYFGGLSHSEIAERCSLPLGTVKTRTRLAMVRLRTALGSLEGDLKH